MKGSKNRKKSKYFPVFCIFTGAKEFFIMQNNEKTQVD